VEWLTLLDEMRDRADKAGFYRLHLLEYLGGRDASNLNMPIGREYFAARGPGLHNLLQVEAGAVGNHGAARLVHRYGNAEQKERYLEGMLAGDIVGASG